MSLSRPRRRVPNFLLTLALALATPAYALPLCDSIEGTNNFYRMLQPWKGVLEQKRFEDLDRHFNGLLDDYAAGRITDQEVSRWFDTFSYATAGREPLHDDWIRQFPNSGAAHLAAAYYYVARGFNSRTGEYASKVSEAQFRAMGEEFLKAFAALEKAETRMKKPTLAAALKIRMLGATGDPTGERMLEIYRDAMRRFPDSLQVRVQWISMSHPKWHGSIPQLEASIAAARNLPAAERRYIEYLVTQEIGSVYQWKGDRKRAAEYYHKALPLCPGLDGAIQKLVQMHKDDRNIEALLPALDKFIDLYPRSGWGYATKGWAHVQRKDWKPAAAAYEKAMSLGSSAGFEGMAWLTEWGHGVPQDYRKAIDLYETAASAGSRTAGQAAENVRRAAGIKMR